MRTILAFLVALPLAAQFQQFNGRGFNLPDYFTQQGPPAFVTTTNNVANGRTMVYGRIWAPARFTGTKDITKIHFRFGTVVKAGGSGLVIGLCSVDTTGGGPPAPSCAQGAITQNVAVANGDANFATNTWYPSGALSANRTISYGDYVAVVTEWDGAGRLGSDSYIISSIQVNSAFAGDGGVELYNGTSWSLTGGQVPNIVLEFTDGTFGTIEDSIPISAIATLNAASNGTEYAMTFSSPVPFWIDGLWAYGNTVSGTTRDFKLVLYEGTTSVVECTFDANLASSSTTTKRYSCPIAETLVKANATYNFGFRGLTTSADQVAYFDVANAAHFALHSGMKEWSYVDRTCCSGAWGNANTTRRLLVGFRVSRVGTGVSRVGPVVF